MPRPLPGLAKLQVAPRAAGLAAAHLPNENPDQPQAAGQQRQQRIQNELPQAVLLRAHTAQAMRPSAAFNSALKGVKSSVRTLPWRSRASYCMRVTCAETAVQRPPLLSHDCGALSMCLCLRTPFGGIMSTQRAGYRNVASRRPRSAGSSFVKAPKSTGASSRHR